MNEHDRGHASQDKELSLTPEDHKKVAEIVSLANQSAKKRYPGLSLITEQVKIVPSVAEVQRRNVEDTFHPHFMAIAKARLEEGESPSSWINLANNSLILSIKHMNDMARDDVDGYANIGVRSIAAMIALGAKPVRIQSERAEEMAIDMLNESYRNGLASQLGENDLQKATEYLNRKGSSIQVRGLNMAIIVEDQRFLPIEGNGLVIRSMDLTSMELILSSHIAQPILLNYNDALNEKFKLTPKKKQTLLSYMQNAPFIFPESKSPQELARIATADHLLIQSLNSMGFVGRDDLLDSFQRGHIGSKIIENYQRR